MSHAVLSPSAASRWLTCTPSARLEHRFPDTESDFAEEGTLAHSLAELLIYEKLALADDAWAFDMADVHDSPFYNDEMYDYCDTYASYVVEQFNAAQAITKDAKIFLETKVDLTEYVPEGFGTIDVQIITDGTLTIIDLKYGKGVPVSATENKQLFLYALGCLNEYDFLYDIKKVRTVIYQPRLDNISEYEISVNDLRQWANKELKPKADLAFKGEGEFIPGAHCRFCKAKSVCKALAEENLQLAKYDFADEPTLSDSEIADILNRADQFKNWINAVEEYALKQAIEGKAWPGYKLVEGRSVRKYVNELAIAEKLLEKGFKQEDFISAKLKGITELEKLLGKGTFSLYLSDHIVKPPGKPCLVPASDKRPEYNSLATAIEDFADFTG